MKFTFLNLLILQGTKIQILLVDACIFGNFLLFLASEQLRRDWWILESVVFAGYSSNNRWCLSVSECSVSVGGSFVLVFPIWLVCSTWSFDFHQ